MEERTRGIAITRIGDGEATEEMDFVVAEEPLEIRVNEKPVSVTLRTPGEDFELAAGFLFTESIVKSAAEIESIRHWGSPNVVRVGVHGTLDLQRLQRHFYSTSSCGVCGKASIDAIRVHAVPVLSPLRVSAAVLSRMPLVLREEQKAFDTTGAIHGAGLFTADATLVCAREDVGRHNAVDKVIGSQFLAGVCPLSEHVLVVSGRTSFEIVQKAIVAGIPIIAAVGAPSSLAIDLAKEMGVTLLGFVREGRFNVYAGRERVVGIEN